MRKGIDCRGMEWEERELGLFAKDLRDIKFGLLTPLFPVVKLESSSKSIFWLCRCDCGNLVVRSSQSLNKGTTKSCGCLKVLNTRKAFEEKRSDMIGCRFGKLTIVDVAYIKESDDGRRAYYKCICDCGEEVIVRGTDLKLGKTTSCGSCARCDAEARKRIDLTGQKFGKLTVVRFAYIKNQTAYWCCLCDCGNELIVRGADLINGHTSSCGCMISLGELNIAKILNDNNIKFLHNKGYFKDLVSDNGLPLRYDFIVFDNEVPVRLIEFDGPQHNEPSALFGIEAFKRLKEHDTLKNQYALSHNIPLVRISYNKRDTMTIEDLLGDKYLYKGEK